MASGAGKAFVAGCSSKTNLNAGQVLGKKALAGSSFQREQVGAVSLTNTEPRWWPGTALCQQHGRLQTALATEPRAP